MVVAGTISFALSLYLMFVVCEEGPIRPSAASAKAQLVYGIPLGLSVMVDNVSRNIDKAMVSNFAGPDEFAIYANGAMELPLFSVLTGSMMSVLLTDYKRLLDEDNPKEIIRLLHRAMLASGTFIFPAMFYLLCVAPEFMATFFGPVYRDSSTVFRIYLLVLPARTLVFGSILLAAGRTRTLAAASAITLVVNAILNYFALSAFGVIGAAAATVVTVYLVGVSVRAIVSTHILKCSIREFLPWYDVGRLFVASMAGLPAVWLLLRLTTGQHDIIRLGVTMPVYGLLTILVASRMGFVDIAKLKDKVTRTVRKRLG